jgi:carbon monoxide dehydrogenase subunit G
MEPILRDDMVFYPYETDGYQCKMKIKAGTISVRFSGRSLFTDLDHPYEVWYPTDYGPTGYQTAEDIWNYIKTHT